MEVPGRKHRDIKGASELDIELLCEPCFDLGQKLLAAGFCVDCNDFLCRECYKHHHKPRVYRDHVLLGENAMPKVKPERIYIEVADNADRCLTHKGEIIKFYCRSDQQLGCGSCMITSHRGCQELISIEEEYEKLEKEIKKFDEQLDSHSKTNEQHSRNIESNHSQAVKEIKHFLTDTTAFLGTLEDKMVTEANKIKDNDEKNIKSISATCLTLRNDLNSFTSDLTKLHQTQQNGQLFKIMEETKDQMKTISKDIDKIDTVNRVHCYSFEPEKQIQEMVGNLNALGKLSINNETSKDKQTYILHTSEEANRMPNRLSSGNKTASKSKTQTKTAVSKMNVDRNTSQVKPYDIEGASNTFTTQTQTTMTSTEVNTNRENVHVNPILASHTTPKRPGIKRTLKTYFSSIIPNNRDTKGNIKQLPFKPRQAYHNLNLNINSAGDDTSSNITGLAFLSDDLIILVDQRYQKVKLLKVKKNTVDNELQLSSRPHDITAINKNQVAMTMPDANQIQLLSISNQNISLGQTIKVKGECHGIVHNEGTLILTFVDPAKVEIISMSGDVVREIDKGTNGEPLFKQPLNIGLSHDKTHVYISDFNKHSITCLTLAGEVKGIYKDEDLLYPRGLTVDKSGSVYVVGGIYPFYMYQISADCSQGQILLGHKQGAWSPWPIAYCHKDDKLYAGQSNLILVYQLK